MSIGIPIMLLHEALPHTVTVETRSGDTYRGRLTAAEDCMNVQLMDVSLTRRDGRVAALSHVFIRGSKIRFVIVPDVLASAPMFKPAKTGGGGGEGRRRRSGGWPWEGRRWDGGAREGTRLTGEGPGAPVWTGVTVFARGAAALTWRRCPLLVVFCMWVACCPPQRLLREAWLC
ncbi:hypothetical protein BU14_0459s0006 [Porphyra umbilicalis]|uniref:Small nuclear ribonucleoprotein Sm D3 n=1 Tax=Porphyra umbilicalis TaxID=2786 RepID=A0A1X6NUD9_PORUM|nr:hypothetical protein BU14_0459s0006 [Porphyra umbilicalis]|eukprot:OSX72185.1 hypothetical protein BU14_0459s0006 [Porphyra umbilicalis]